MRCRLARGSVGDLGQELDGTLVGSRLNRTAQRCDADDGSDDGEASRSGGSCQDGDTAPVTALPDSGKDLAGWDCRGHVA
jgi:hypothetical protein